MASRVIEELAIIIPTAHRPVVLHETLLSLQHQSCLPGQIVVAVPSHEHILKESFGLPRVQVVQSPMGSAQQRNRAIESLSAAIDIATFLDDDVELDEDYFAFLMRAFRESPTAAVIDGLVLADGVKHGGILRERARAILAADRSGRNCPSEWVELQPINFTLAYGCNMSVRRSCLRSTRFDERLRLYGMWDDLDFAAQCVRYGPAMRCRNSRLVHLGHDSGRLPGKRFGYCQVMNPVYFWRKGTMPTSYMLKRTSQALVSNAYRSLVPGNTRQRGQRLGGNLAALRHVCRGRIAPEHVLEIEDQAQTQ